MHASYRKQLARKISPQGKRITLNKTVVDHKPNYYVCSEGKSIREFQNKDAAKAFFDRASRGEIEHHFVRLEDFESAAIEIDKNRTEHISEVNFPTLAALNKLIQTRKGRVHTHLVVNNRLSDLVGPAPIPKTRKDFECWLDEKLNVILEVADSQSYGTQLLRFFNQIFFNMVKLYPFAFSDFLHLIPQVQAAVLRSQSEKVVTLDCVQHNEPLHAKEVENLFDSCADFKEMCLLSVYLGTALRSGEAELLRAKHILHDGTLLISEIQSKTASRKKKRIANPPVSLAVRAAISWLDSNGYCPASPAFWPKKHFRSTCATYVSLAGLPSLSVSARLGHTSRKMSDEFYVKPEFVRICLGSKKTVEEVLFRDKNNNIIEFSVVGKSRENLNENVWDWWLLFKLAQGSSRFNQNFILKELIRNIVDDHEVVSKVSYSF